jgi:hypothetical protein
MLTYILAIAVIITAILLTRSAIERPRPLNLRAGETILSEVYARSSGLLGLEFQGFTPGGSSREGRLILTDQRLLYTDFAQKRVAFSIEPGDVVDIKIGKTLTTKSVFSMTPKMTLTYVARRKGKTKTKSWSIPREIVVHGNPLLFVGDKKYPNPGTVEEFAVDLRKWAQGLSPALHEGKQDRT